MTASMITAADLARQAITCFLTHCAIEEDETTHHAYYMARIADKARQPHSRSLRTITTG